MKKLFVIIFILLCFEYNVYSSYIVLVDDVVIEENDIHKTQSVASISKIMTALIAIENGDLMDKVNIDKETTLQIGSSLYMLENESYSLLSLIYGLMLRSGNDAAYAISKHVGGNVESFVKLMNQKAIAIGMKETTFSNPSGLDEFDDGNISSVYDMALCMREAMKNEIFRMIVNTRQYKAENNRVWINKNRLLNMYEYANGGKTGYTTKSGKTLVTSASYNGLESIVVSFRENDYFNLHKRLHEKINQEYKNITLIKKGSYKRNNKNIIIDKDINLLLKNDEEVSYKIYKDKQQYILEYTQLNESRKVIINDTILE